MIERPTRALCDAATLLMTGLCALACSRDEVTLTSAAPVLPADSGSALPIEGAASDAQTPLYALSSLVFGPEDTTSYVSLLSSLEPQAIDYTEAREFSGQADLWVHDGSVFIADAESLAIRKFAVVEQKLVERGAVSLAAYGLTDFGFWLNTFISPTKAYFLNGAAEYIIWDPTKMVITGTVALPELEERDGFQLFTGYTDRAALLKDGRLYQPLYWTDESFFEFTPDSRIAVYDVATDTLVDVLEAPCPGLDYATVDEAGNLYFSSWIFAAGGAAVLDQPPTCVVQVTEGSLEATRAFAFADVTEGREGAAMRYVGGGNALISVLHHERATPGETDAAVLTYGANWRFWSYDLNGKTASMLDTVDWNAGAQYSFDIDDRTLMLVAAGDYSATTLYDLREGKHLDRLFETRGWSVRLFRIR